MSGPSALWNRALAAVAVLAADPTGLGGLHVRARCGPVRDRLVATFAAIPLHTRRIHPGIGDDQLYGGADLLALLVATDAPRRPGLLETPCLLLLPMAERTPPGLAARLAGALDAGSGHCVIALDEGEGTEEGLPAALADRMAISVDLSGLSLSDIERDGVGPSAFAAASVRLADVVLPDEAMVDLVMLAAQLGVAGLRAPLLAIRVARAAAAIAGRSIVTNEDLELAVALVFASRATCLPMIEPEEQPEEPLDPPPSQEDQQDPGKGRGENRLQQEILLDAVRAALPEKMLARLAAAPPRATAKGTGGTGAKHRGNRRGRPLSSRAGRLDGAERIDLVATLRAAAPWQAARGGGPAGQSGRLAIRPADIRVRRFEEASDRLLIFAVDASGSAAMMRLAEAKGAVELLLAEAYARRDYVALVSFRGTVAEVLLPATRSLVQTKRRLALLPGGGGTPLAAGIKAGIGQALAARARGMTPTLVVLTDGRANICLDGSANRDMAAADARRLAALCRGAGFATMVIDTAPRPQPFLRELAGLFGGPCIALPHADARSLAGAVSAALGA